MSVTGTLFQSRRPDWFLTFGMLVGGTVPIVGLMFLTHYSTFGAVLAGLLFWPCALTGGLLAQVGEGCDHDWLYDHEESQGPWTGYIERCSKCGAISQVPM